MAGKCSSRPPSQPQRRGPLPTRARLSTEIRSNPEADTPHPRALERCGRSFPLGESQGSWPLAVTRLSPTEPASGFRAANLPQRYSFQGNCMPPPLHRCSDIAEAVLNGRAVCQHVQIVHHMVVTADESRKDASGRDNVKVLRAL